MSDTLLTLQGITKAYPGTLANDRVDLSLARGEIHALLGENGAGKSTLVKIIYGVVHPDSGTISWNGQPIGIPNPHAARARGIGMVFQHFSLFEGLTVAENLALGIDDPALRRSLRARLAEISARYGLHLDGNRHLSDLSLGERQRIEIVRCLLQSPKLLIMDEPTSVLTPGEVEDLFATLRQLAENGCTVLYISHKLEEIRRLCTSATIMRGGRVVARCDPRETSAHRLAELMIGETQIVRERQRKADNGAMCLVVDGLSLKSDRTYGTDLDSVSFSVAAGQILGIAGIAGNGQTELMDALSGEKRAGRADEIVIGGTKSAKRFAADIIARFDVRTTGPSAEARALSGGNLQKFIVGREVLQTPRLLVLSQPTWGVDAGAAAAIHRALLELARGGAAIVIISQDLDEILSLCDTICVISSGRLSPVRPVEGTSLAEIGLLMSHAPGRENAA
jgi:ABC-type uncharacterized transport system ATPase subunit